MIEEPQLRYVDPLPGRNGDGHEVPRRSFGHSPDRLTVVEPEAVAIRDAAARVLDGETLSSIVAEWNRLGLRTAGGGPWRVNSLSNLLVQARLTAPPTILDAGTHERLLALHASRSKGPRRTTRRYLLTGLLRCWRCGGGLRGMPRSRRADLYVCPGPPHGGCSGTAVTADHADAAVRDLVLHHLDTLAVAGPSADQVADMRQVRDDLAAHSHHLDELADMWTSGEISRIEWLSLKRKVGDRAKVAEAEMHRLRQSDALRALAGRGGALGREWPTLGTEERRNILHTAVDHVVVLAAEPPRQVFRPERLQLVWRR